MRCEEAQAQWLWAEREAQAASPEVARHIASCETCQAFQVADKRLSTLLSRDVNEPPGPGFDTRFFARLEAHKRAGRRPWWYVGWGVALAGAAAASAVLWAGPRDRPDARRPEGVGGAIATTADQPGARAAAEVAAEDLEFAMHLELLEAMPIVEKLEDLQALALLERDEDLRQALETGAVDDLLHEVDVP